MEKDIIKSILVQIFLCATCTRMTLILTHSNLIILLHSFIDIKIISKKIYPPYINVGYVSNNLQLSHYIVPESSEDVI